MKGEAPAAIYAIDTSSLMDWYARCYPTDVFPGILSRLEDLVAAGRLVAPRLVEEEIEAVGPAGLKEWVDAHPALLVPTREVLTLAVSIQNQFAGLRDPKAGHEEADAYVIVLARQRGGWWSRKRRRLGKSAIRSARITSLMSAASWASPRSACWG